MEENLKQQKTTIIKIALFGPESTGKTTLAKQLAEHYQTKWVPEFARDYLQEKWEENQHVCIAEDMMPIAYGQVALENEKLSSANKYLFCDTNLMVTKVFSEMYYDFCDPLLNEAAIAHEYDLFFLTNIDVPWEKDDIRDTAEGRDTVFTVFKQSLIETKKPFITLSGNKQNRLAKATTIIDALTKAKENGFSSADFVQIYEHGIPIENILQQLEIFKSEIVKNNLIRPATIGDGILNLSENDFLEKATYFDSQKSKSELVKFVPASGAASRMFKFLTAFMNDFDIEKESINAYINRKKESQLSLFIVGMDKFPFYDAIYEKLKKEFSDFDKLNRDYKNYYFIKLLLSSDYFDFANKPKAVLPFHKYKDHIACPIDEHLNECVKYGSSNAMSNLHFTVSEIHQDQFEKCVLEVKDKIEFNSKTKIDINYSYQCKSTDSISVDEKNNPFRNKQGNLIFRPGGHGALIKNLNALDFDIIFIKNIDNIIQNHIDQIALYKKALAGILIELQNQTFGFLNAIHNNTFSEKELNDTLILLKDLFSLEMQNGFDDLAFENKSEVIKEILDRPIRVCGMVKNEGEPGGGPFWTQDKNGAISLQIVETSEVDLKDKNQLAILANATHFNPVDIVCGVKSYKNEKFDLTKFVDVNRGFLVEKSIGGKMVKSYELPGLWNGAMSNWLTVFVAVPLLTFNPVKNVNDLLKAAHQPQ